MRLRLLWLLLPFAASCAGKEVVLTRSQLLMGNIPVNLSLRIPVEAKAAALDAGDGAYRLAGDWEARISEYRPDSEISCLNRQAGKAPCPLSPGTLDLLKQALSISEKTGGSFDIRFASPTRQGRRGEILLRDDPPSAFLAHPETRIGIGAIGKGWIVDRMIDFLSKQGFSEAVVDAGGDLRASGAWRIAVQVPHALDGQTSDAREIRDRSLATSGLYERGPHILDPASGKAVDRAGSVSVEAADLTTADALSTAFFVMGESRSRDFLASFPGIRVLWLDPNGKSRASMSPKFIESTGPRGK